MSNNVDQAIARARAGSLGVGALIGVIMEADLALPSAQEIRSDGSGFEPLFFDKEGTRMMVAFSDKDYAIKFAEVAPYCMVMKGRDVLQRLPPRYGLVVNPGREVGFDISPEGISRALRDLT